MFPQLTVRDRERERNICIYIFGLISTTFESLSRGDLNEHEKKKKKKANMADYMQLLKVITIIMNLSNSAIMFYNTPSKDLNSHLIRDLKNVIKDACFINVDEEGQIFQDSYKMGQTGKY